MNRQIAKHVAELVGKSEGSEVTLRPDDVKLL